MTRRVVTRAQMMELEAFFERVGREADRIADRLDPKRGDVAGDLGHVVAQLDRMSSASSNGLAYVRLLRGRA